MRISRLDKSQVEGESAAIYDHYFQVRGNVPNMFRTVAHRPEILRTLIAHFRAIMETGTVPARLKELLTVRVSQLNDCEYWLASHTALARRQGWSQEQLDHLPEFEGRPDFDEKEKAALRLAERMTLQSNGVDEALWAGLRRHFDEGEVVELAAVIGLFNYFNRFNNALEMEPTK